MCYHISTEVSVESIIKVFPDVIIDPQLKLEFPSQPYLNGFDHPEIPVIVKSRKRDETRLVHMTWGFLPSSVENWKAAERFWNGYTDANGKWVTGFTTLNAVGAELLQKKMYR